MKISVIIPVYNAERYVGRCIDSILRQSVKDFELILVNDVSKDNSSMVCKDFVKKDNRVRYYENKENLGVSGTRNKGLEYAKGDFVMFCDDDDIVAPCWIEHLLDFMLQHDSILPICSIANGQEQLGVVNNVDLLPATIYPKERYYLFNKVGIAGYIWNTIYRRDIIEQNGLRFRSYREKGDINEDLIFSLDYVRHVNNVAYVGYADYYHAKNETNFSSVTDDKYYYEKYREKYQLWSDYINKFTYAERKRDNTHIATSMLYHFVRALNSCIGTSRNMFEELNYFKRLLLSDEMDEVLNNADLTNEGEWIVKRLKKKQYFQLWALMKVAKLLKR